MSHRMELKQAMILQFYKCLNVPGIMKKINNNEKKDFQKWENDKAFSLQQETKSMGDTSVWKIAVR